MRLRPSSAASLLPPVLSFFPTIKYPAFFTFEASPLFSSSSHPTHPFIPPPRPRRKGRASRQPSPGQEDVVPVVTRSFPSHRSLLFFCEFNTSRGHSCRHLISADPNFRLKCGYQAQKHPLALAANVCLTELKQTTVPSR